MENVYFNLGRRSWNPASASSKEVAFCLRGVCEKLAFAGGKRCGL